MIPFNSKRTALGDWAALACYPTTLSAAVHGVDFRVQREPSGILILRYVLRAEMAHVRVPPVGFPARADGLWKHTCFEVFISPGTETGGYYELNFSPSRQWAIYRFQRYREGMSPADVTASPELALRRFDDRLELDATLGLAGLKGLQEARTLKLAVSTVIEDDNGTLSYWALKHAPGKPDFHHPESFVLELPGEPMGQSQ
jgi:hypothetical protein